MLPVYPSFLATISCSLLSSISSRDQNTSSKLCLAIGTLIIFIRELRYTNKNERHWTVQASFYLGRLQGCLDYKTSLPLSSIISYNSDRPS
jgi:hypothetical protein